LKPERWGSPLVQEKYQEEKASDNRHPYCIIIIMIMIIIIINFRNTGSKRDLRSSVTLRSHDWQLVTDVSGQLIGPIFKGQEPRHTYENSF